MSNYEVKENLQCLHRPAWDSIRLGLPETVGRNSNLEGKIVLLRTRDAIYSQALVIKDFGENIVVRFVSKTHSKEGITRETNSIQKRDIKDIRVYQD